MNVNQHQISPLLNSAVHLLPLLKFEGEHYPRIQSGWQREYLLCQHPASLCDHHLRCLQIAGLPVSQLQATMGENGVVEVVQALPEHIFSSLPSLARL